MDAKQYAINIPLNHLTIWYMLRLTEIYVEPICLTAVFQFYIPVKSPAFPKLSSPILPSSYHKITTICGIVTVSDKKQSHLIFQHCQLVDIYL